MARPDPSDGVPIYGSGGMTDSKLPDAQAGYEKMATLLLADRQKQAAWEAAGNADARVRATACAARLLREHEPPGLPPEVDAEIRQRFDIMDSGGQDDNPSDSPSQRNRAYLQELADRSRLPHDPA